MLALHIVAYSGARLRGEQRDDRVLDQIDDFMRANLASPLSLAQIAQVVERSTFQIIRLTKRGWGETPFAHLTRLRMEHANRLLLQDGASTWATALQCGYSNPTHFALAFRRHTGMSPSMYRTKHDRR